MDHYYIFIVSKDAKYFHEYILFNYQFRNKNI